ncbi:MAG: beta-ketothiolase BktB [Alphaproteobacteria bacterium]|nr:beta-ketothiolase BktB [Alphaproteobacteria bacterium]MDG2466033.1 beta-ketothiolase BktB [Alphaproteobacteria bacterium]
MNQVYIVSATRSAIGSFGGTLKDMRPIDLGITIAKSAITQSGLDASALQHAVIGHVIHTEPKDQYISRAISIGAGMPEQAPALTVNRLCGSGLQSIVSATQMIQLGDAAAAMAGGVEVMSKSGYLLPAQRWGARMGNAKVEDMMLGALNDPFDIGHMGITAENVASDFDISRDDMDAFAAESQRRAAKAQAEGWFTSQITPVEIASRKTTISFDKDEYIRGETTQDKLGGLRAAFQKDGAVTAGNSSGINDGSAMLILASEQMVEQHGLKPLAKIVSYGFGGVPPRIMGMGPVPATRMALEKSGLKISDLDVVESNEAFAAQACAVSKELGLASDIVNPNGGAIALGHPVGATGSIIMTKLIHELHRRSGRMGLATMCIGGGQGISVIIDTSI